MQAGIQGIASVFGYHDGQIPLLERREIAVGALLVQKLEGSRVAADHFDQLAGGDLERCRRGGWLPIFHRKSVHCDREHAGEVFMGT